VKEIAQAIEQTGSRLPLGGVVRFTQNHLACELWQEGATVFLAQFDGRKAVGHWKADQSELLNNA
jgi:hypothetical protein